MKLWLLRNSFLVKVVGWVAVIGYYFLLLSLKTPNIEWYWYTALIALAIVANVPFVLYLVAASCSTYYRSGQFASLFFPSMVSVGITAILIIYGMFAH